MLRLRPYKPCDAEKIASWITDKRTFDLWGGAHFGAFPLTAEAMNDKYLNHNGDCVEEDNFYPMTAFDEEGVVGHFIMRYIKGDNKILRLGWVVVDASRRGKGYGRQMIDLALKYAFEILKVDTVTIGVFEVNTSAYKCYQAAGFRKSTINEDAIHNIDGEDLKVLELEISKEEWR